ncbi:MAG: GntR family transcriptional regulator [Pseudomonadota bacterium]
MAEPDPPRDAAAVRRALRAAVAAGEARVGDRLPGEAPLAKALGAGPGAARAALAALAADGVLLRSRGSGTLLRAPGAEAAGAAAERFGFYAALWEMPGAALLEARFALEALCLPGAIDGGRPVLEALAGALDDGEAFHAALIATGANPLIVHLAEAARIATEGVGAAAVESDLTAERTLLAGALARGTLAEAEAALARIAALRIAAAG